MAKDHPRSQKTQPKGNDKAGRPNKPIEIPVLKREDFEQLLRRATKAGPAGGAG
jgi:hypothetical protein